MPWHEGKLMRKNRMRVLSDGSILFKDPDESVIPVLRIMDPGFRVESVPPPKEYVPNLRLLNRLSIEGFGKRKLDDLSTHELWLMHERAMKRLKTVKSKGLSKR
jgi:hypothetical protein